MSPLSRPFSFFRRRKHQPPTPDNREETIAWTELLAAQGPDLWSMRAKALGGSASGCPVHRGHSTAPIKEDDKHESPPDRPSICHLHVDPSRPHANVRVFCSIQEFVTAERDQGMDKIPDSRMGSRPQQGTKNNNVGNVQALTQAVGDEWVRQRRILKDPQRGPLQNLKEQSLRAARAVNFAQLVGPGTTAKSHGESNDTTVEIDLKQIVLRAVCEWAVRLFHGRTDPVLSNAFLNYWNEIRQQKKNPRHVQMKARQDLVEAISWDGNGLFQAFQECGFASHEEGLENALHAMVAGADAAACLIFWTLWNLGSTQNLTIWESCRNEIRQSHSNHKDNDTTRNANTIYENELLERDLDLLAAVKLQATQGLPIENLPQLSCLGRSLVETVRIFPPVWTLPRAWGGDDAISAKLDVPTVNGALDPRKDWNPQQHVVSRDASVGDDENRHQSHTKTKNKKPSPKTQNDIYISSFGVGKRSCPAGTAALLAAMTMLWQFVETFEKLEECQPEKALHSAYLGPTLAVDGPQFFRLTCDDNGGLKSAKATE
eukprot:CAMPEP_0172463412 /NCGR_PEP_ID=MMETSP1065-20121228/47083_1 /TAXON_ID=265537 /ORGANISM="Amphiprora paludosa, Strain CCMP125" /LENGTH=544 /DNA_ID=CAMNT_0013219351 /DNA_START=30 /DNA_END=1664 /DNA_ORIENTATION=+